MSIRDFAGKRALLEHLLPLICFFPFACSGSGTSSSADAGRSDADSAVDAAGLDASSADSMSTDASPADAGPSPVITFWTRASPSELWQMTTRSFWGDAVDVRMAGLPAGKRVTVKAVSGEWRSAAIFLTEQDGSLDLATASPESGSYSGVDADGIFWSMDALNPTGPEAYAITLTALAGGSTLARATLDRYWAPDGAAIVPVSDNGLVGVFVSPTTAGRHPALITFGGSEGGLGTGQILAEYYASLGYACLGLAYFGAPGLPEELVHVPLEYFGAALAWIEHRPEVDPMRIGVMGGSRGGELALLLGATYPAIKAVVATIPSGVVWSGTSTAFPELAAWTYMGRDLPFIPYAGGQPTVSTDAMGNTVYADAPAFLYDLAHASTTAKAAATIPVERINGPVLMIGGADDQLWASCTLSQVAIDRLTAMGHVSRYGDRLECYPNAGHNIDQPNLPTVGADEAFIPSLQGWFLLGGTPEGIAHASRASDTEIRAFLKQSLGP
jgi:dienelactone hydrolase